MPLLGNHWGTKILFIVLVNSNSDTNLQTYPDRGSFPEFDGHFPKPNSARCSEQTSLFFPKLSVSHVSEVSGLGNQRHPLSPLKCVAYIGNVVKNKRGRNPPESVHLHTGSWEEANDEKSENEPQAQKRRRVAVSRESGRGSRWDRRGSGRLPLGLRRPRVLPKQFSFCPGLLAVCPWWPFRKHVFLFCVFRFVSLFLRRCPSDIVRKPWIIVAPGGNGLPLTVLFYL